MNYKLFDDFCEFSNKHIASCDIDPVYPMLAAMYDIGSMTEEDSLWFTYLYVAFYNLQSAEYVFTRYPRKVHINDQIRFPTGVERRGMRGNDNARTNINEMVKLVDKYYDGSMLDWLEDSVYYGGIDGWRDVRTDFEEIKYNGSWASYKWADIMLNVHGYDIVAADIGVGGKSETAGPIPGMVKITGRNWRDCATIVDYQYELLCRSLAAGVKFSGLDQLETCLCDFNSMLKGGYYIGHDIDLMMKQLDKDSMFWRARMAALPCCYLGELNGWSGARKELNKLYAKTGVIGDGKAKECKLCMT